MKPLFRQFGELAQHRERLQAVRGECEERAAKHGRAGEARAEHGSPSGQNTGRQNDRVRANRNILQN
jgi:hypothetical protein